MKTLIIYLSATGNTRRIAHEIADKLEDADLLPIQLITKIPESEFWRMVKIGFFMWLGKGMRYSIPNLDYSVYNQIIVGTPVWMGKAATPVINVMNKLKIKDDVKGFFATYGAGPGIVFSDLSEKIGIESMTNCLAISISNLNNENAIQNEIKDFINALQKEDTLATQAVLDEG